MELYRRKQEQQQDERVSTLESPPTKTTFTSGSGTYNVPAGVVRLKITAIGGGGGGAGGAYNTTGIAATVNTGGGGGASGDNTGVGGAGGSGKVILRLITSEYSGTTTGSPTVTTVGTETVLTFTGSGTYVHS